MNVTREFLAKARVTDDSAGRLIAVMRQDPEIPDWFPHARAMCEYVQSLEGYVRDFDDIEVVWRRYRTWVYRNCEPEPKEDITFAVRIPLSLRQAIKRAASEAKLDIEAWAMEAFRRSIYEWPIKACDGPQVH
jgi:hypothetical protein